MQRIVAVSYLYGVRRTNDIGAVPELDGVDLVTCALLPDVRGSEAVNVAVAAATPTAGVEGLDRHRGDAFDGLTARLAERERSVSAH